MPFPKFSELPSKKDGPLYNAWGVFGEKDELGTLNHITGERVAEAAKTIKTGQRVSLDWDLNLPEKPYFHRSGFQQHIINKAPRIVNDDVLVFNTQCSSQWDSFKHYAYQSEKRFYNDCPLEDTVGATRTNRNGIQNFAKYGIAGRGVLLDVYSWAEKQGKAYDPHSAHPITLADLKAVAQAENVHFQPGDILLVRTGHVAQYNKLSTMAEKHGLADTVPPPNAGIVQDVKVLEWVWDTQFAAIAADNCAWELQPTLDAKESGVSTSMMHAVLLSGFGCPIGELWNLEELAQMCKKEQRWTFFMTSAPLMVPGGVASPPNAMAIF